MEQDLEPKLEMLLAQKVKPQAMRKEPVTKKEQHFKFKSNTQTQAVARQQFKRSDPQSEVYPVDSESTLSRIARQNFGVELSIDSNDGDKKLPAPKPSGRGFVSRRGNTKLLDCYNMDVAPMNIFENQIIPVGIHNLSKGFCPNLANLRVLALGTKFFPK